MKTLKNEQMLRYFRIILEILSYLAALGALFLVGHIEMWSGVAALFAAMLAVIILFLRERKIFSWILFISAIMETVWIFTRIYLLYLIGLYLILLIVIFLVAKDWRAGKKNKQGDKETTVLQKAGAVVSIFLSHRSLTDCLAVGSGFGYYSLSSIFITEYKGGELGTVALLANISREILTLLAAPLLVRWFGRLASISAGGATTMDTTLPVILQTAGQEFVVVSIFHGFVVDFSVPFLVTFFCSI